MKTAHLDKTIAGGLLVAVAFTALAHGAVEAWSVAVFQLLILLLLLLWAIKSFIEKRFELNVPLTVLPLAAFFLLGLIQSISVNGADGQIKSFSFDVEATRSTVKILFFLLGSHLLAANFFKTRERLRSLVIFLTIFGFGLAIFGLLQYFTWNGHLYWLRPALVVTQGVIGPFVNHNHFAGYLELIVPLPIALIVAGAVDRHRMLYGFAAVLMAIASIASLSRGGMISMASGLLFIIIAGIVYTRRQNRAAQEEEEEEGFDEGGFRAKFNPASLVNLSIVALIIGAVILGTFWLANVEVIERVTKNEVISTDEKAETFEHSRGWIWENSLAMFRMNPVCGVGMGAFETAYPNYSRDNRGLSQNIDRAHNDYLQVLSDTGLIGGAIALAFILMILFLVGRSLRSREPFHAGLAIGCGGAIFSMLVHSAFDFNLQIPSTSLLFLVLTAVSANLARNSARS
ncbi:MAG TPA: O-antigen ligase family protein [Pyrinomonadaceae bacterium]|nr:O-antigen ligase family protein [Pyrinomonadaceae bacterium]